MDQRCRMCGDEKDLGELVQEPPSDKYPFGRFLCWACAKALRDASIKARVTRMIEALEKKEE